MIPQSADALSLEVKVVSRVLETLAINYYHSELWFSRKDSHWIMTDDITVSDQKGLFQLGEVSGGRRREGESVRSGES